LCSDRKLSYGDGQASSETGFKFTLAGGGWAALIAGPTSDAEMLASFFRNHLESAVLREDNYRVELNTALVKYREWVADQYIRKTFFTTLEKLLAAKSENGLGKEKDRILKEAAEIAFPEQLIISGFIQRVPHLAVVSWEGITENPHFACIGSGAWLAQAILNHREYTLGIDIDQAMYLIYEAKKFSEKENAVGEATIIFVQETPLSSADRSVTLRPVSRYGLLHLEEQYRRFGLQKYKRSRYRQPKPFYE
jgi:hypothetical protein